MNARMITSGIASVAILAMSITAATTITKEVTTDATYSSPEIVMETRTSHAEPEIVLEARASHIEPETARIESFEWSDEESDLLMQIAMAEAEGEGVQGKALVMCVVLNRVLDDNFPNCISEVILEESNGTHQFSTTRDGGRYWTVTPDDECREALALIENGWNESQGATYFESGNSEWFETNLEFLFQYGGHRFYKEGT